MWELELKRSIFLFGRSFIFDKNLLRVTSPEVFHCDWAFSCWIEILKIIIRLIIYQNCSHWILAFKFWIISFLNFVSSLAVSAMLQFVEPLVIVIFWQQVKRRNPAPGREEMWPIWRNWDGTTVFLAAWSFFWQTSLESVGSHALDLRYAPSIKS